MSNFLKAAKGFLNTWSLQSNREFSLAVQLGQSVPEERHCPNATAHNVASFTPSQRLVLGIEFEQSKA